MSASLVKIVDQYWKYVSPVAILFMAWMQTQFVPRGEFQLASEKVLSRIEKIEQILIRMESAAETDKRHDSLLFDHEQRIRNLEKK